MSKKIFLSLSAVIFLFFGSAVQAAPEFKTGISITGNYKVNFLTNGGYLDAINYTGNASTSNYAVTAGTATLAAHVPWSGITDVPAFPGMPSGSINQTLRHTGSGWAVSANIFSDGDHLGIGINNPSYDLDIYDDAGPIINLADGSGAAYFYRDSGGLLINDPLAITWQIGASSGSILNDQGNLGVGKTNPGSRLDVNGAINSNNAISGSSLCLGIDCITAWSEVGGTGTSTSSNLWTLNGSKLYASSTTWNVGIGTTNPLYKLDVSGNINTSGILMTSGTLRLGASIIDSYPALENHSDGYLRVGVHGGDGSSYLLFDSWGSNDGYNAITAVTDYSIFNGNVGIGMSSPSQPLVVQGSGIVANFISTDNTRGGVYIGNGGAFSGDEAGLYDSGSDQVIAIYDATLDGVRLGSDIVNLGGQVGIGKTNPGSKLDVVGAINSNNAVRATSFCLGSDCITAWNQIVGGTSTSTSVSDNWTLSGIDLYASSTSWNVGIGTTHPTTKLEVNGDVTAPHFIGEASTAAKLSANGTNCSVGSYPLGIDDRGAAENCTAFPSVPSGISGQTLRHNGTTWAANSLLYNNGTKIGIGTTSPLAELHVVTTTASPAAIIQGVGKTLALKATTPYAEFYDTANNRLGWFGYGLDANDFYFSNEVANKPIYFSTNGYSNIRMTIDGTGNVGIGKTDPGVKLDVTGAINSSLDIGTAAYLKSTHLVSCTNPLTSNASGQVICGSTALHNALTLGAIGSSPNANGASLSTQVLTLQPASASYGGIVTNGSQTIAGAKTLSGIATFSNATYSALFTGGNVGIGTPTPSSKLQVIGTITASEYVYTSDSAYKKNIQTLDNSLSKILQLRGVSFNWKKDNAASVGLIAQEVEKVYPELVIGQEGNKAVKYGNLVAPLIEAIKEQQRQIDILETRIKILEINQK